MEVSRSCGTRFWLQSLVSGSHGLRSQMLRNSSKASLPRPMRREPLSQPPQGLRPRRPSDANSALAIAQTRML
jgi:hypothetical protein